VDWLVRIEFDVHEEVMGESPHKLVRVRAESKGEAEAKAYRYGDDVAINYGEQCYPTFVQAQPVPTTQDEWLALFDDIDAPEPHDE